MINSKTSAALMRLRAIDEKYKLKRLEETKSNSESSSSFEKDLEKNTNVTNKEPKVDVTIQLYDNNDLNLSDLPKSASDHSTIKSDDINNTKNEKTESIEEKVDEESSISEVIESELESTSKDSKKSDKSTDNAVSNVPTVYSQDSFEENSDLSLTSKVSKSSEENVKNVSTLEEYNEECTKISSSSKQNENFDHNETSNKMESESNSKTSRVSSSEKKQEASELSGRCASSLEKVQIASASGTENKEETSTIREEEEKLADREEHSPRNRNYEAPVLDKHNVTSESSTNALNFDVQCENAKGNEEKMFTSTQSSVEKSQRIYVKKVAKESRKAKKRKESEVKAQLLARYFRREKEEFRNLTKRKISGIIKPLDFPKIENFIMPDSESDKFNRDINPKNMHFIFRNRLLNIRQWLKIELNTYHSYNRLAATINEQYNPTTLEDTKKMIQGIQKTFKRDHCNKKYC